MEERLKQLFERVKEVIPDADQERCMKFVEQCVEFEIDLLQQTPCDTCPLYNKEEECCSSEECVY